MSISGMSISEKISSSEHFKKLKKQAQINVASQLDLYNKNYKSNSQLNMAIRQMVKGPDDSELFFGGKNPQKIALSINDARALLDITTLSDSQKNQIIKEANL